MKPTAGRIVQYIISLADIEAIAAQRQRMAELLLISAGQLGNTYVPGETVSMIIARVWSDTCVNGQLILDGADALWVTSRNRDDSKPHQSWHWPEIEGVCELRVEATSEQPLNSRSDAHEAVSTMAAKVARLEDDLSRKRQAENDLIRDRDRLIQQLVEAEQARDRFSDRLARAEGECASLAGQNDTLKIKIEAAANALA